MGYYFGLIEKNERRIILNNFITNKKLALIK
jgi:hypothetical protein